MIKKVEKEDYSVCNTLDDQYSTNTYSNPPHKKLTPTSKSAPCGVCGDETGKCRILPEGNGYGCMKNANARKFEVENGYKCVKTSDSNGGLWATFVIDDHKGFQNQDLSEAQRLAKKSKKLAKEKKEEERKRLEIEHTLSATERHEQYSMLLGELKLDYEDSLDLQKRGFTREQLQRFGAKSVRKYQKVKNSYNFWLPGIGHGGDSLVVASSGYLCPVRNYDQQIVAFQIRLRDPETTGRYRWLNKSGQVLKLPDVWEMPLAVFKPENPKFLGLVEGIGAKAFLASERLDALVIGASGGQWAGSPQLLETYIKRALEEFPDLKGQPIRLFPDAGDIQNQSVIFRWRKVTDLLEKLGHRVLFCWWNQKTKQDDDIDELDIERLEDIEFLTPKEFFEIKSDELTFKPDHPTTETAFNNWLNLRKYTPTPGYVVNQQEFKFPELPESGCIVGIRSGLGTFKTGASLDHIKEQESQNTYGIWISPRVRLNIQTVNRGAQIGVTMLLVNEETTSEHPQLSDPYSHLTLCPESLHKIQNQLSGKDVYIDEVCGSFSQILGGGTLKGKKQAECLEILKKLFNVCKNIYLLDANLTDKEVSLVSQLTPEKKVIKILNTCPSRKAHFTFVEGFNADKMGQLTKVNYKDKSGLVDLLSDPDEIPCLASDSKMFTDIIDILLQNRGRWGFRLNQDSSMESWQEYFDGCPLAREQSWAKKILSDPQHLKRKWADELMADPDAFLAEKKPQYFAFSPTAQSGISITLKGHFTCKVAVFVGVLGTDDQMQMLFRLRDNEIPAYIHCPISSSMKESQNNSSCYANALRNELEEYILLSEKLLGENELKKQVVRKAKERSSDPWFNYSIEINAKLNFEKDNLRSCLDYALQEAGHTTGFLALGAIEKIQEELIEIREEIADKESKEIFKAEAFEDLEAAMEAEKSNPTKLVKRQIQKSKLLDALPGIEQSESWSPDFIKCHLKDRDFIWKLNKFWLLQNPEVAKEKHEETVFNKCTQEFFFKKGLTKLTYPQIWALQELGVPEIIKQLEKGKTINKQSPLVINAIKLARENEEITRGIGFKVSKERVDGKENIEFVKKLLGLIGVKLEFEKQSRLRDGIRLREYQLDRESYDHPYRKDTLDAIDRKYQKWLEERIKPQWEEANNEEFQAQLAKGLNAFQDCGRNLFLNVDKPIGDLWGDKSKELQAEELELVGKIELLEELAGTPEPDLEAGKELIRNWSSIDLWAIWQKLSLQAQKILAPIRSMGICQEITWELPY